MFIDETWASTNMTPRYGRCEKGKRLIARAPFGHWKTTTFLAALRCDGITAPCVFDGPINGEKFRAYVEQILVPTLRPGDIVIMDNLGSHKSAAVREAIEAAGATRWLLPPYSPDLDPIEQVFAKLKTNYEKWRNEPSTPSGTPSLSSLRTSPQPNASTISATQDTVPPKEDTL